MHTSQVMPASGNFAIFTNREAAVVGVFRQVMRLLALRVDHENVSLGPGQVDIIESSSLQITGTQAVVVVGLNRPLS